jgi:hypothetical protein
MVVLLVISLKNFGSFIGNKGSIKGFAGFVGILL